MSRGNIDTVFAGSIPKLYQTHLVPLIFEPYAVEVAARVASLRPARVLEIAAGTGVVTRHLASALPADASIVATDLNPAMLTQAMEIGTRRNVTWREADAMRLPFDDAAFDVVVCQFGAMFFPDRAKAYSEARRVLRDGGSYVFSVWDRIENNEFADVTTRALAAMFPDDPPRFLARTPHGYHEQARIASDLVHGGFSSPPTFSTVTARSRAESSRIPAIAYCQGTPLRGEIEARAAERLAEATDVAAKAIAARFGSGPVDGKIQAHIVVVDR
ncbi:MAG TPA: class I SAM-dependent methyltransferase [Casimicrobiaceae bacterium]|nr:class I SAM-dependent methyltransferase [Casimicrobiaceae bacterium]